MSNKRQQKHRKKTGPIVKKNTKSPVEKKHYKLADLLFYFLIGSVSLVFPFLYFEGILADPALSARFMGLSVLMLILSAGILLTIIRKEEFSFSFTLPVKLLLSAYGLYWLWGWLGVPGALAPAEAAYEQVRSLLIGAYLFMLLLLVGNDRQKKTILLRALVIMSAIFLFYGLKKILFIIENYDDYAYNVEMLTSTLANQNLFSSAMLLALPACFYLLRYEKWHMKILPALVIVGNGYLILLIVSRTVWGALSLSLLLTVLFLLIRFAGRLDYKALFGSIRKLKAVQIAILFFIVAATGYFVYYMLNPKKYHYTGIVQERLSEVFNIKNENDTARFREPGNIEARFILWGKSMNMLTEKPLTGIAPGNWRLLIPKYGLDDYDNDTRQGIKHYQRPHNDFMGIAAERGIPGGLFYLLFFLIGAWYCSGRFFRAEKGRGASMQLMVFAALVAFVFVSFFSFPAERIMQNLIIMSYLAVGFAGMQNKSRLKKLPLLGAVLFIGLFSGWGIHIAGQRIAGEKNVLKIVGAQIAGDNQGLLNYAREASQTYFRYDSYATPFEYYEGFALYRMGKMQEAEARLLQAKEKHPYHIHIYNTLAAVLYAQGRNDEAIAAFEQAVALSADYEEALKNLAVMYMKTGQTEKARHTIDRIRGAKDREEFAPYYYHIMGRKMPEQKP